MPIIQVPANYADLENILLNGMNDPSALNKSEIQLTPIQYRKGELSFQNVHQIRLEADFETWNNGAWFILKPRFFNQIKTKSREQLNVLVSTLLNEDQIPHISDEAIYRACIENTKNDVIFDAFVMMKIMMERFASLAPQKFQNTTKAKAYIGYLTTNYNFNNKYQINGNIRESISPTELALAESIWPGLKNPLLWEDSLKLELETIGLIFGCLQEIIAKIAVNASLQSIALEVGLQKRGLTQDQTQNTTGICDLSQNDLDVMSELLSMLPETRILYLALAKNDCPLALTLSQLLGAVLEQPTNVPNFLKALNLKAGTAQQELNAIEKRILEQNKEPEEVIQIKEIVEDIVVNAPIPINNIPNLEKTEFVQAQKIDEVEQMDDVTETNQPQLPAIPKNNSAEESQYTLELSFLLDSINKMKDYAVTLPNPHQTIALNLSNDLIDELNEFIFIHQNKAPLPEDFIEFQKSFTKLLHGKDTDMGTHRAAYVPILMNIGIALTGVGLAVIALQLITSKLSTGKASFFFEKTHREVLRDQIEDNVDKVDISCIKTNPSPVR